MQGLILLGDIYTNIIKDLDKAEEAYKKYYNLYLTIIQCDAIRWEQLENWHFLRGYTFWSNDLLLILKTSACPYSCLAEVIFFSELV